MLGAVVLEIVEAPPPSLVVPEAADELDPSTASDSEPAEPASASSSEPAPSSSLPPVALATSEGTPSLAVFLYTPKSSSQALARSRRTHLCFEGFTATAAAAFRSFFTARVGAPCLLPEMVAAIGKPTADLSKAVRWGPNNPMSHDHFVKAIKALLEDLSRCMPVRYSEGAGALERERNLRRASCALVRAFTGERPWSEAVPLQVGEPPSFGFLLRRPSRVGRAPPCQASPRCGRGRRGGGSRRSAPRGDERAAPSFLGAL